jgi:hypothetical protein
MSSDNETADFSRRLAQVRTRFTEFITRHNDLANSRVARWVFLPGMLFRSPDKWWGDRRKRDNPHEGLDLCWYRSPNGQLDCLAENTRVPVLYDGIVAAIVNDYLGQSVIVEHELCNSGCPAFCTIYGHTNPSADLRIGKSVKRGDIVAAIAGSSRSNSGLRPHLHISLAWTDPSISYDRFDWKTVLSWDAMRLLDPLDVLDAPYEVADSVSLGTVRLNPQ